MEFGNRKYVTIFYSPTSGELKLKNSEYGTKVVGRIYKNNLNSYQFRPLGKYSNTKKSFFGDVFSTFDECFASLFASLLKE